MFAKLNVKDFSNYRLVNFSNNHIDLFKKRNKDIFIKIEDYLLREENTLSASQIEKSLFPIVDADIFISHSHQDEDDVIRLALMLEDLGLKVFVDSCYWGYAGDLQRKIDDRFCGIKGQNSYYYQNVLNTSANINNILTSALHGMIDKAELFLFLGTDNSVALSDQFGNGTKLKSPWISSELMFAQRVRMSERRTINASLEVATMDSIRNESVEIKKSVNFIYDFPEMQSLDWTNFEKWLSNFFNVNYNYTNLVGLKKELAGLEHLDRLYRLMGVNDELLMSKRLITGNSFREFLERSY